MAATRVPSPDLLAARRSLDGVRGLSIEADWSWYDSVDSWVLGCRLSVEATTARIPGSTDWFILVQPAYPYGSIRFLPSKVRSLERTFPHQQHNGPGPPELPWRTGELCLTTPSRALGRLGWGDEPRDAHARLEWHARRAIAWLEAAAAGILVHAGDPFELPHVPGLCVSSGRIAFSESRGTGSIWKACPQLEGWVQLGAIPGTKHLVVERFTAPNGCEILQPPWAPGLVAEDADRQRGFWVRLDRPPVLEPWHVPRNWNELAEVFASQGRDLYALLRRYARHLRDGRPHRFLMGFPVPERVGEEPGQLHWMAILLPILSRPTEFRRGFRPNEEGFWQRERATLFRPNAPIEWIISENWHSDQIARRGRFAESLSGLRCAIIGVGALGSAIAEILVRGGVRSITLVDPEHLEVGNLVRHTLLLTDVGRSKAEEVAARLRLVSPHVSVRCFASDIRRLLPEAREALQSDHLVLDCTGSDEVLHHLGTLNSTETKFFGSLSLGGRGRRLYAFAARGYTFPFDHFLEVIEPWTRLDAEESNIDDYPWEGIGCWHPVFPAGPEDLLLFASSAAKWLASRVVRFSDATALTVFESYEDEAGFAGVRRIAGDAIGA